MKDGFPLTLWPGSSLPAPVVLRGEAQLAGETLHWTGPDGREWLWTELPDELVIRELIKLDLGDEGSASSADAVWADAVAFMNAYGAITRVYGDEHPDAGIATKAGSVRDATEYLVQAQRLARHWVAFNDDAFFSPIWFREDRLSRTRSGAPRATEEEDAWVKFLAALNHGLQPFHARAEMVVQRGKRRLALGEPKVDLYAALCLQLTNLIVEGEPLRQCASETCSYRFVRQRGGAQHGQFRTKGVLYCTPSCAQAQAQREYRRRKKETP